MRTHLPSIGPMERALFLRSIPLFRRLRAADLAASAQSLEEVSLRRDTVLYGPRIGVPSVYLLVEGQVVSHQQGEVVARYTAPDVAGLVELLAGAGSVPEAVARTRVLALTLDAAALFDLIEDRFRLFLELRRALGEQLRQLQERTGIHHRSMVLHGFEPPPQRQLTTPERLLMLQRLPLFQSVGLSVLAALSRDEVELVPGGTVLWEAGDEAASGVIVVEGELRCEPPVPAEEFRVGRGDMAGAAAMLGGLPHSCTAVAARDVALLRLDAVMLVDLAEDNPDLAQGILATLAREILRLQPLAASRKEED